MVLKELFLPFATLGVCGGHERTDFLPFAIWEFVVVMKELIFYISNLGVCGGLERTDF